MTGAWTGPEGTPRWYERSLDAEAASWFTDGGDAAEVLDKYRRERMRHHKLARDLLLDRLDTCNMDVLEVGGGPMPVSDLLPFRSRVVLDPLTEEYRKVAPCPDHRATRIEDWLKDEGYDFEKFDLIVATNSLDHVQNPMLAFYVMHGALRRGGYMAIAGAENNALTHPHPAHKHNLTAETVHRWADEHYETVWELTYARDGYRYGWRLHDGRRGQPAFAMLLRGCE